MRRATAINIFLGYEILGMSAIIVLLGPALFGFPHRICYNEPILAFVFLAFWSLFFPLILIAVPIFEVIFDLMRDGRGLR